MVMILSLEVAEDGWILRARCEFVAQWGPGTCCHTRGPYKLAGLLSMMSIYSHDLGYVSIYADVARCSFRAIQVWDHAKDF